MNVRDKVLKAAEQIAAEKPFDQITFAEIAAAAGVHWTAVRRHLGNKQEMRSWLQAKQIDQIHSLSDTRTRIVEAAIQTFSQLGYTNASLEKVAATAGMTKGAVYWHFSSKQDLFLEIIEHNLNQQLRLLPGQIKYILEADDPETALSHWLQSQFACLEEGDGTSMLFFEFVTSSREPEVRKKLQAVYGKALDAIGLFLEEMQRKNKIAAGLDPQSIGIMVDALTKGVLIEWLIDPERCNLQTMVQTITKVLWRGLAPNS